MRRYPCIQTILFVAAIAINHVGAAELHETNLSSVVKSNSNVTPTGTTISYSGPDGTVQFTWTAPTRGNQDYLGNVHVSAHLNGTDAEVDVPFGLVQVTSVPIILQSTQVLPGIVGPGATYKLNYLMGTSPMSVTVQTNLSGKSLFVDLQADQPYIGGFYGNVYPNTTNISAVNVPYYSSPVSYFPDWRVFGNAYFDFQNSNATQIEPMQAAYLPLTNGKRNLAKDRLIVSVSQNIGDVVPTVNNAPSLYQSQLAGRTVIDIWNQGSFPQITQALNALAYSGVKNCVVLVHIWQNQGYDNALPGAFPADSSQGGNSQLAQATAAAKKMGCYVGVHENYVDYYPDYSGFTSKSVGLNSDSSQQLGWLNNTTGIQSFGAKQTWMMANAKTQDPLIHSTLGTSASFIDVMSAGVPWFRPDMDATQAGAGMFSSVVGANKSVWSYEQQTHGGPVFGEGLNHWFWSGQLDGVEAQLGAGNNNSLAEHNPLLVDFDLLKIHPLQVNHGMGMYERWLTAGESITQTNLMDSYRMQEVIFGHAPYIGGSFWMNPSRVLQEQNLVSPVAQRYGTQTANLISYQVNGAWTDANAATKANDWSRVAVQYANGDILVANGQPTNLSLGGLILPQYGWAAQGQNLLAYTALVNGMVGDYSQSGNSFFANARNSTDQFQSGAVANASINGFQQAGPRAFAYQLQWQVLDGPAGTTLADFIHFVDKNGNVAFQGDYLLSVPTSLWKPGQIIVDSNLINLPSGLADGIYSMRIGLFATQTGLRVQVLGLDDGSMRYILGNVIISNHGQSVIFQPQAAPVAQPDPRMNANGSLLNFGTIQTDGMVSINLNQSAWSLQTYPRYRNVAVQLSTAQFPAPSSITCDSMTVKPSPAVNGYWQLQTNGAQTCSWSH